MKAVFSKIYKILRTLIVIGIVAFVTVFVTLYLILLIPRVQNSVKGVAEKELSALLDTHVSISKLTIEPFNKIVLKDVSIPDKSGKEVLTVDKLGVGLSLYNLVMRKRVVFTYAEVLGLNGYVYKTDADAPLNIQFIIDALSPKDKNKPPTKFDIGIYNIVLRRGELRYDVLNADTVQDKYDKNHISINDLRADIALPRLKNDIYNIKVKRLSFREQSGLMLKNLTVNTVVCDSAITVSDFRVELPQSYITTKDFTLSFDSLKSIGKEVRNLPISVNTTDTYITPSDFACFVPKLKDFTRPINVSVVADGTLQALSIPTLNISSGDEIFSIAMKGEVKNLLDSVYVSLPNIKINAKADEISAIVADFAKVSPNARKILTNCGNVQIDGALEGDVSQAKFTGNVTTLNGRLHLDGYFSQKESRTGFRGKASTPDFNLARLLGKPDLLGHVSFNLNVDGYRNASGVFASLEGTVPWVDLKGYRYHDVVANVNVRPSEYEGELSVNDENLLLDVTGTALFKGDDSHFDADVEVRRCNLAQLNLSNKYPHHQMSFKVNAVADGTQMDNLNGKISINEFAYVDSVDNGIKLNKVEVLADNTETPYTVSVRSDVLNGNVQGNYRFDTLIPAVKRAIADAFPALFPASSIQEKKDAVKNDFVYTFTIESNDATNNLLKFFKAPVELPYPVTLNGHVDEFDNTFGVDIDAKFIAQKDKLIEDSKISIGIDSLNRNIKLSAHTKMPVKHGKMTLDIRGNGVNNRLDTDVAWVVDREGDFHGNVDFSVGVGRVNETDKLMATINVHPTTMVFNDTAWYVHDSKIGIYNNNIRVDDFRVTCDNQFVRINGKTSLEKDDKLEVELKDINLGYVFETLRINNVTFGGFATGKIVASELLSQSPHLATEKFFVEDLTYNETLLGDADMNSFWDNDKKFVAIKADISQPNGCKSKVDGEIYPMNDSLRFDFEAEKLKVGFMKPFMEAITSDLDGFASGRACLFGKFSTLNMWGDIFVEDLKVKVDYTNVYYWATDSVKIIPGLITFKNVTLKDRFGKNAMLTGYVAHDDFHNARFKFDVTDAKDFLCYDIPDKKIDPWYGTIFGTGTAAILGEPGEIDIAVHMETAANSKFYFELSDAETALEYDFITFTDKRKEQRKKEELEKLSADELVVLNFEKKKQEEDAKPTRMIINIEAEINPLGQLILVMDPAGGDKVKATGSGNLIMKYDTASDLEMRGTYTLEKGTYNFTLQDIIVKDFKINEGSTISFDGNPYAAQIGITASYSLNANLLDLDESFAADKELNRTNVPVNALLKVAGSIAAPEISFDLEFPTLTSDAYRKVRSIVSTDDMMNRQIIYLLALNRFYTPEYMGGTNRNNELASVASSTISSQLSSMLGQINENLSISPNFKSDKGDFSDVEVNLALSSQLLNNRLLLNGNFGYRDKMVTANNSNFIGDFDIEYLLNKRGNVRLKAYNHFNDQSYYVKNALTTQGVGVVFKFDFDNPFTRLRKRKGMNLNLPNVQDSVNSVSQPK